MNRWGQQLSIDDCRLSIAGVATLNLLQTIEVGVGGFDEV
jgi:hypothetical protein